MTSHTGFLTHLGITRGDAGDGRAVLGLDIGEEHLSPTRTVHGGVLYSLADTAMGAAIWTLLDDGETCATISANVDYLGAVRAGSVECEAEVVRKGKRTAFTRALVRDGEGVIVAQATAAFHIGAGSDRRLGKGATAADG